MLSYIQNIGISVYLNVYPQWSSAGRVPFRLKGVDIEKMWSWLGCVSKCRNLRQLNISLEADTCEGQEYLLDQFEHYGRERIGLLPKINVAFTNCLICKDRKKSQHWRWGSKSGSQGWKVIHFIGDTQVSTCLLVRESRTLCARFPTLLQI